MRQRFKRVIVSSASHPYMEYCVILRFGCHFFKPSICTLSCFRQGIGIGEEDLGYSLTDIFVGDFDRFGMDVNPDYWEPKCFMGRRQTASDQVGWVFLERKEGLWQSD